MDLRYYPPEIQKRTDQTAIEEEDQEAGTGLRQEKRMEPIAFQQERWRLEDHELLEHGGRGHGRGDRHGRPRRRRWHRDAPAGIHIQPQDRGDQSAGDQISAHQAGESQVHATQLVQNAQDLV